MSEVGFHIEVNCQDPHWWHYNVAFTCGCFDAEENRTGFASAESHIANVGTRFDVPPKEAAMKHRKIELDTPACHHIRLYLYIIPHTLPEDNSIEAGAPFDIEVKFSYNGKHLRSRHYSINRWSGASLEIKETNLPDKK